MILGIVVWDGDVLIGIIGAYVCGVLVVIIVVLICFIGGDGVKLIDYYVVHINFLGVILDGIYGVKELLKLNCLFCIYR